MELPVSRWKMVLHRCIMDGDSWHEDIMHTIDMKTKPCKFVNKENTDIQPSGHRYKGEVLIV